ncbi:hypothetical protein KZ810_04390 [Sphingomonas sp. RHCKR47]|uniref:hypothetical protein n=1 Tax=Sphingomonas citricola TaxID=2862498 RepID=UPI001CA4A117|nr:hypothetical protein [Sphingomonas citricola]MBW6522729.1 hypothetical protein [Sphingomonas citricola]
MHHDPITSGDHDHDDSHGHGHGMTDDLPRLNRLLERRRALQWFVGAGTAALVSGCGGSDGDAATSTATTTTATPTPTPTATTTSSATAACIADPAETAGPYPGDGTNTASGSTSNVLTLSGIVRSDIRWPHFHFEVFSSLSNALSGRYAVLTSQLAMSAAACTAVYSDTAIYPSSSTNFARVSLSSDNVSGGNTAAQIAQQTPTLTGTASAGYPASAVIGIAR